MLIKMTRADDGHSVDVHPDMVADYETGGYRIDEDAKHETLRQAETKTEAPTQTPAPVKRRRPRKGVQ